MCECIRWFASDIRGEAFCDREMVVIPCIALRFEIAMGDLGEALSCGLSSDVIAVRLTCSGYMSDK